MACAGSQAVLDSEVPGHPDDLGALVAGLRAGYIYNTWPLIDGALVPDAARLFLDTPAWRNIFENTLTAQFDHRMMAYAIFICALLHAFDVTRTVKKGWVVTSASVLALAVTLQAALGIATLLLRVPISLALAHQAMAMLVLTVATTHRQLSDAQKVQAGAGPDVVRLSIGIEDKEDIIADLEQALAD